MNFATDEEIIYAHSKLLEGKDYFEEDKLKIIKCNHTKDIKACPGSGKTTTLLAKLIILANKMPLPNNQGICVLTHTNVAIEEIKDKLGHKADILFRYPNFFGTIQSFVDKFLANPALYFYYNSSISRVDNDIANERLHFEFLTLNKETKFKNKLNSYLYKKAKSRNPKDISNEQIALLKSTEIDFVNKEIKNPSFAVKFTSDSGKLFLEMKENLFKKGILSFTDAYNLGFRYCDDFRDKLKKSFSSRFAYLFIDEMQDTDKQQIELVDNLFNSTNTIIQRFGDPFQAIYQNKVEEKESWNWLPKLEDVFSIHSSKRFGENIAKPLRTICIQDNLTLIANDKINSLNPILLIYNNVEDVLPKFSEILTTKNINNQTIWNFIQQERTLGKNALVKAIGWVGVQKKEEITLQSYFPNYNRVISNKNKIKYNSLASYLVAHDDVKKVKFYFDKIIEAFCYILNLKEYRENKGRRYSTKTSFLKEYQERSEEKYNIFRHEASCWITDILVNKNIIERVRKYIIEEFCPLWEIETSLTNLTNFLNGTIEKDLLSETDVKQANVYKDRNLDVEFDVATVHSVKGETHIATLYLETYHNKGYESKRILSQMFGLFTHLPNSIEEETLKIAYVGMSRPQYLLCFAVRKEHIEEYIEILDISNNGMWEIVKTYKE